MILAEKDRTHTSHVWDFIHTRRIEAGKVSQLFKIPLRADTQVLQIDYSCVALSDCGKAWSQTDCVFVHSAKGKHNLRSFGLGKVVLVMQSDGVKMGTISGSIVDNQVIFSLKADEGNWHVCVDVKCRRIEEGADIEVSA